MINKKANRYFANSPAPELLSLTLTITLNLTVTLTLNVLVSSGAARWIKGQEPANKRV